jgi:hypothetical protein
MSALVLKVYNHGSQKKKLKEPILIEAHSSQNRFGKESNIRLKTHQF